MSEEESDQEDYLQDTEASEEEEDEEEEVGLEPSDDETPFKLKPDGTPAPWDTWGKDAQIVARTVLQRKPGVDPNTFKTIRAAEPKIDKWIKQEKCGKKTTDNIRRNTRALLKSIHAHLINGNGLEKATDEFITATGLEGRAGSDKNGIPGFIYDKKAESSSKMAGKKGTKKGATTPPRPRSTRVVGGSNEEEVAGPPQRPAPVDVNNLTSALQNVDIAGGGIGGMTDLMPFDQIEPLFRLTVHLSKDPMIKYADKRPLFTLTVTLGNGLRWDDFSVSVVDKGTALLARWSPPEDTRDGKWWLGPLHDEDEDYTGALHAGLRRLPLTMTRKMQLPVQCESTFREPDPTLEFADPNNCIRRWIRGQIGGIDNDVNYLVHVGKCCIFALLDTNDDSLLRRKDRYAVEDFTDFNVEPETPPARQRNHSSSRSNSARNRTSRSSGRANAQRSSPAKKSSKKTSRKSSSQANYASGTSQPRGGTLKTPPRQDPTAAAQQAAREQAQREWRQALGGSNQASVPGTNSEDDYVRWQCIQELNRREEEQRIQEEYRRVAEEKARAQAAAAAAAAAAPSPAFTFVPAPNPAPQVQFKPTARPTPGVPPVATVQPGQEDDGMSHETVSTMPPLDRAEQRAAVNPFGSTSVAASASTTDRKRRSGRQQPSTRYQSPIKRRSFDEDDEERIFEVTLSDNNGSIDDSDSDSARSDSDSSRGSTESESSEGELGHV